MPRCILFLLLPLAAAAQPQPAAPAAAPTASKAKTEAAAELTPEQRVTQFRRDEINLLALRADAPALLAAAVLAVPDANDAHRPAALKPPALLARAQAAAPDDVRVWWVTAGVDCHATDQPCPQTETLQKLENLDAQNAAVWLLSLLRAERAKDAPAARAALTSAAQAPRFDDYFGKLLALIVAGERILPVGDEVIRASGQLNASDEGYRLITAAGAAAAILPPVREALTGACRDAAKDKDLAADCLTVAKKLAVAGSLGAQNFGIRQWLAWLPADADTAAAKAAQRALAWHALRIGDLAERLADDPDVTRVYLQALDDTGTETGAVYAVLRSQGVALEPPADWQPPADGVAVP
jgi:hypothetical protein